MGKTTFTHLVFSDLGADGRPRFTPYEKYWEERGANTRELGLLGAINTPNAYFELSPKILSGLKQFLAENEVRTDNVEIKDDVEGQSTLEEVIAAADKPKKRGKGSDRR